ncbi:hypothetical protein GH714_002882 [Hevea brasiliensis]|uniref:Uncharacterized protein n=1 Tax=Hevea brasiliensis TaxID=3981 RepID=A0A6A6KPD6_HEVBR|nr:hypothetical protein GH714_002882 [Hevea brasiliensis]
MSPITTTINLDHHGETSTGYSNNQTNPPLAITIIPDNPGVIIVTSFNPSGSYLDPVATFKEITLSVLPCPLSDSYEILLGIQITSGALVS